MRARPEVSSRRLGWLAAAVAAFALSACGERPQAGAHPVKKGDAAAFKGPQAGQQHTAPGWTPGDADSWRAQIRARNQGQNEYNRSPAAPVGQ